MKKILFLLLSVIFYMTPGHAQENHDSDHYRDALSKFIRVTEYADSLICVSASYAMESSTKEQCTASLRYILSSHANAAKLIDKLYNQTIEALARCGADT